MRKLPILMTMLILLTQFLSAEMAPDAYRNMQLNAPEQLEISVQRVTKRLKLFTSNTAVTVHADVLGVLQSETNLKPGDSITITYIHYKQKIGWAGPGSIPILEKNTTTIAFLEYDEQNKTYIPAAGKASFDPLIGIL